MLIKLLSPILGTDLDRVGWHDCDTTITIADLVAKLFPSMDLLLVSDVFTYADKCYPQSGNHETRLCLGTRMNFAWVKPDTKILENSFVSLIKIVPINPDWKMIDTK